MALQAPARLAAARTACAGPSARVPSPAGAPAIRPGVPVARGPRNRARAAPAAGATAAARVARVAPAVAVGRVPLAVRVPTGAGVNPAVRVDPMTRGARASPAWSAAVLAARTTLAAVGAGAGATSAA